MQCVTVLYQNSADIRFDFDYYIGHHVPLMQKVFGKGITRVDVRKCLSAPDGSPPAFLAVITIGIGDEQAYQAGLARTAEIVADVANFTNKEPIIQIGEQLFSTP